MRHTRFSSAVFAVLILCSMALSCATLHGPGIDTGSDVPTTTADRRLLIQMWFLIARDDGIHLEATYPAYIGAYGTMLGEGDPVYRYTNRAADFFDAHQALLSGTSRVDRKYRKEFARAERAILEQLPERPGEREGRMVTYQELLKRGILQRILTTAGPSTVQIPEEQRSWNEWGLADGSFILTSYTTTGPPVADAALQFKCCQGKLYITKLPEPLDLYNRAHELLLESDAGYRERYLRARQPYLDATERITKPLSAAEAAICSQITVDYRSALEAAGILDDIERTAASLSAAAR